MQQLLVDFSVHADFLGLRYVMLLPSLRSEEPRARHVTEVALYTQNMLVFVGEMLCVNSAIPYEAYVV